MSELIEVLSTPELERPVLIMALEGWIDAGFGAAAALAAIRASIDTEPLARFDADALIDHRARRPVLRIVEGVNRGLTWPDIELLVGQARTGRSVLLLVGPEPDLRWHAFARETVALARDLGVELVVGLGAFPAPVAHSRPVQLVATATTADLAASVGYLPTTIDVPAGIGAVLESAFSEAEIPAVTLWARVPHYVAAMPYPAASAALVERVAQLSGIELDSSSLRTAAELTHQRIEELVGASEEHVAMVRQLEAQPDEPVTGLADLPTGEEIAAELERYLRGER